MAYPVRALVGPGLEVHLLSQGRHPERQPFVDAIGEWQHGELQVHVLRDPVRCTVYRPDIRIAPLLLECASTTPSPLPMNHYGSVVAVLIPAANPPNTLSHHPTATSG